MGGENHTRVGAQSKPASGVGRGGSPGLTQQLSPMRSSPISCHSHYHAVQSSELPGPYRAGIGGEDSLVPSSRCFWCCEAATCCLVLGTRELTTAGGGMANFIFQSWGEGVGFTCVILSGIVQQLSH